MELSWRGKMKSITFVKSGEESKVSKVRFFILSRGLNLDIR